MLAFVGGYGVLPFFRENGERVIVPFCVLLAVGVSRRKPYQMPDAPRDQITAALDISVLSAADFQRGGDILRDARFLCDYKGIGLPFLRRFCG